MRKGGGRSAFHTQAVSPAPSLREPSFEENSRGEHRETDWTSSYGKRICGICHPPASSALVADEDEDAAVTKLSA